MFILIYDHLGKIHKVGKLLGVVITHIQSNEARKHLKGCHICIIYSHIFRNLINILMELAWNVSVMNYLYKKKSRLASYLNSEIRINISNEEKWVVLNHRYLNLMANLEILRSTYHDFLQTMKTYILGMRLCLSMQQ